MYKCSNCKKELKEGEQPCPWCGHTGRDISEVVNETMNITESVSTVIFLNFELYDRVHVGGAITGSDEITFLRDTSDPNTITGFAIKVRDPDEEKVKSGITLGERTVNFLSALTIRAVRSKRPKIEKQAGNTPQMTTTNTPKQQPQVFNLDATKLSSSFSGNDLLNKKLASYQSGMAALEDSDPEKAVPRFHQVIEKTAPKDAEYYQPLRDACSHVVLDSGKAVIALNNDFKIKCTIHKPVDFTDADNWQQLYIHAHALKQVAGTHIQQILAQSNLK
jgi:hypothetical protein